MQSEIKIRIAIPEDRAAIRAWYLDPLRRAYRKDLPTPPTQEQHWEWFSSFSADGSRLLYIGLVDILRIGAVRFDEISSGEYLARVMLKPSYCGKGMTVPFLQAAIASLRSHRQVARVLLRSPRFHPVALHTFREAGFEVRDDTTEGSEVVVLEQTSEAARRQP